MPTAPKHQCHLKVLMPGKSGGLKVPHLECKLEQDFGRAIGPGGGNEKGVMPPAATLGSFTRSTICRSWSCTIAAGKRRGSTVNCSMLTHGEDRGHICPQTSTADTAAPWWKKPSIH
jgi:hypothetical protein